MGLLFGALFLVGMMALACLSALVEGAKHLFSDAQPKETEKRNDEPERGKAAEPRADNKQSGSAEAKASPVKENSNQNSIHKAPAYRHTSKSADVPASTNPANSRREEVIPQVVNKTDKNQPAQAAVKSQQKDTLPAKEEIISHAVPYYTSCQMIESDDVDAQDLIKATRNKEINWKRGSDNKLQLEYYETEYHGQSLVLYRDLKIKKYLLVLYKKKVGHIQKAAQLSNLRTEIKKQIEEESTKTILVPGESFLVRTNTYRCIKNHIIEDIFAVFRVFTKSGSIIQVEVPAAFCHDCRIFFIHEYIFQKLQTYGTPLCQIISEKVYISGAYLKMQPGFAQTSLLRMCGYNVSSADNLSAEERRRILEAVIGNGLMTKHEVITHLESLIRIRREWKKDMSNAISKWESDIDYLYRMEDVSLKRYQTNRVYRISR